MQAAGHRLTRAIAITAVGLALARGRGAAADCRPDANDGGVRACTAPAASANPAPGADPARPAGAAPEAEIRASHPDEIVSSDSGVRHELDEAQKLLDEGEETNDESVRRAKYEAARDHAGRAVAAMPRNADAHFVHFAAVGRLAQMKGISTLALQMVSLNAELDQVLEIDPDHANALAARGGMYMKLPRLLGGDKSKGVAYLERAVSLDKTAVGKRLELAEAYRAIGRDGDAGRIATDARAVAIAEHRTQKIATCDKFISELRKSCPTCVPDEP